MAKKGSSRERALKRQAIRRKANARDAVRRRYASDRRLGAAVPRPPKIASRQASGNEHDGVPPPVVYRFFRNAEYADAFCAGRIRISTLGLCSGYEDPMQGNPQEAQHTYINIWADSNEMSPSDFRLAAARAGIVAEDCTNVLASRNRSIMTTPDAFVLCCTEYFAPELLGDTFGRVCVQISDSIEFFNRLSARVGALFTLRQGRIGKVTYRRATFVDAEPGEVPMGFMRDPDKYAEQREVRMLWHVASAPPLSAIDLNAPEVASLCRRIA